MKNKAQRKAEIESTLKAIGLYTEEMPYKILIFK